MLRHENCDASFSTAGSMQQYMEKNPVLLATISRKKKNCKKGSNLWEFEKNPVQLESVCHYFSTYKINFLFLVAEPFFEGIFPRIPAVECKI